MAGRAEQRERWTLLGMGKGVVERDINTHW